jgi:RNA polymerase sigma-70 factor (sigma-E family)
VLTGRSEPTPSLLPLPGANPGIPDFDAFVLARGRTLLAFAQLVTGDRHQAEDIVQEVLARAHLRWARVSRMQAPEAYLRKAITREYLSWRRRRVSGESVLADPPDRVTVGDLAARTAERDQMWQLLAGLPGNQRAVLVLRFYCDLPDEEIADVLGCARPTVRSQASRGLARLRTMIASEQGARHG